MARSTGATRFDTSGPTWLAVQEFIREQRESARSIIDTPGLDAVATELQRGKLQLLEMLEKLPDVPPKFGRAREPGRP